MADENKPEDTLKEGEDHCVDEIRYACMSRQWKLPKPIKKMPLVQPLTFNDLKPITPKKVYERRI